MKNTFYIVDVDTSSIVATTKTSRTGEVRLQEMISMLFVNDNPTTSAMTYAKNYRPEFVSAVRNGHTLIAVAA